MAKHKVGDMVRLESDGFIPADLVLIASEDGSLRGLLDIKSLDNPHDHTCEYLIFHLNLLPTSTALLYFVYFASICPYFCQFYMF